MQTPTAPIRPIEWYAHHAVDADAAPEVKRRVLDGDAGGRCDWFGTARSLEARLAYRSSHRTRGGRNGTEDALIARLDRKYKSRPHGGWRWKS